MTTASTNPMQDGGTGGEARRPIADPANFLNRDLSWLEFNRRVLAQAADGELPLFERLNFMMICTSNLDEFFMKRVAWLRHQLLTGYELPRQTGTTLRRRLREIREIVTELEAEQARIHDDLVIPGLRAHGIRVHAYATLRDEERAAVDAWFQTNVFPVLTPLAVDPGHRFPFISNLSESLGVLLRAPDQSERNFARLKIPDALPGLVRIPGTEQDGDGVDLVSLEEIVLNNLDDVFRGMEIIDVQPFRVTRSVGLDLDGDDEDVDDLLEHVEAELRQRRFAEAVRLEVGPSPSRPILELLLDELDLDEDATYERRGPLDYSALRAIVDLDMPALKQRVWRPVVPPRLRDEEADIFSIIRERDVFVHHPYDSFTASIERFVEAAAEDPNVLAIKQTLYRTSRDSPFIESLIHAAEEGKQVACLVELRARFDEDKNVRFARQLEKHGVHVAYGVVGLKTHCKCSLVVRREQDGLRSYAHVGTGNYHPGTAQLYTDCGLLTCDPIIVNDVINLFNYLTGRSRNRHYDRLVVAPVSMREHFLDRIDREARAAREGRPARIVAKMNSLEDRRIIHKLYEASQAGVDITLLIRGLCCIRPGVPGLSESITVLSVIGRFLEHSRIFHFADGAEDPLEGAWYMGSADWMTRNLSRRVEVICPVADREARAQLQRIVSVSMDDRKRAWCLGPDGRYTLRTPAADADPDSAAALGTFETLCRDALARRDAEMG